MNETSEAANILRVSRCTEAVISLQQVIEVSSLLPLSVPHVDETVNTSLKTQLFNTWYVMYLGSLHYSAVPCSVVATRSICLFLISKLQTMTILTN
jgi:hypothetical protein